MDQRDGTLGRCATRRTRNYVLLGTPKSTELRVELSMPAQTIGIDSAARRNTRI